MDGWICWEFINPCTNLIHSKAFEFFLSPSNSSLRKDDDKVIGVQYVGNYCTFLYMKSSWLCVISMSLIIFPHNQFGEICIMIIIDGGYAQKLHEWRTMNILWLIVNIRCLERDDDQGFVRNLCVLLRSIHRFEETFTIYTYAYEWAKVCKRGRKENKE